MKHDLVKSLIEQCTEKLQGWDERRGNYTETYVDKHKLIVLVARECANIVKTLPPGYEDYRSQIEDAFRRDCIAKIQEKFGIAP